MYGLESLNLAQSSIARTDHLSYKGSWGAHFNSHYPTWQIRSRGGYMEFTYNIDTPKDINLSLRLCSGLVNGRTNCPITVYMNGQAITRDHDPHKVNFYNQTWWIPGSYLRRGDNTIRVKLQNNASTIVFLQGVKVGNYEMQPQKQTNWCWDATGISTVNFLKRNANTWTQCTMYDEINGTTGACQYGYRTLPRTGSPLNQGGWPSNVLNKTGNYAGKSNSAASWAQLEEQMNQSRPVGANVWWKNGGGHAMAITSIFKGRGGTQYVVIDDPWYGRSTMTYNNFKTAYKSAGDRWGQSVFCK